MRVECDWEELRKWWLGFVACPLSGALGPSASGLPRPSDGLWGQGRPSKAEPLGKEECGCSSGKLGLSLNPVKMNHGRLAEVAVLTLSQSEQHKALLRRKTLLR